MTKSKTRDNSEDAEILAINALGFLASDSERLQRFMELSGLDVAAIRVGAANPAFLGGILDHLLGDESLLLIFAGEQQLRPERIAQLRRKLPGAAVDF
ncbi:MAG: DUF3572 domain-containing protein [Aestuariivirga sp.]|uniref:DUF3572 domain-containing protein n=1 Tax=Aestuariivirga sp. TaxID=2650926 RepID=UPI0025B89ED9|nr:DUF3572 domain-containing protein [Aestuariivirga sp.]MCA3560271.1 DUF3572 domain-containing protein [Aestuariivirga sp.]